LTTKLPESKYLLVCSYLLKSLISYLGWEILLRLAPNISSFVHAVASDLFTQKSALTISKFRMFNTFRRQPNYISSHRRLGDLVITVAGQADVPTPTSCAQPHKLNAYSSIKTTSITLYQRF
jgi:hypothetical protein